ncbi:MAG: hypothetical protein QNI98_02450 [Woeseiaceae bacterium]|nr:hypothetical protein [Woeseiaceae bacterium]
MSAPQQSSLTDDFGRTRLWVLLLSSFLIVWSLAIYAYIVFSIPPFQELFAGFGGELPSLTTFVLEYGRLFALLAPISIIPLVSMWRKRAEATGNKARDLVRVVIAFVVSLVIGSLTVYGLYLPIFEMGAVVS